MIRRPKAGETEDDLLRYQEEFLAQKAESAVKLVKKGDKRKASGDESHVSPVKRDVVTLGGLLPSGIPSDDVPVKRSKFKSQRTSQKTSGVGRERVRIDVEDSEDMEETMDRHDGHITSVLSDIIERDIQNTPVYLPRSMTQGFPSVSHRGNIKETKTVKEKKALSLFAQHFSKSSPASFGVIGERQPMTVCTSFSKPKKTYHTASTDVDEAMEVEETGTSEMSTQAGSENPILITGSGLGGDDIPSSEGSGGIQEAKKIHQENLSKLSELSEEEILAEQEKLKSMLDPKVVQFIRSRKQHTSSKPAEEMTEAVKEETTAGTFQQEEHHKEKQENFKQVTTSEVTLPIRAEKDWVNMNVVEEDKMEWMHDVPKPKPGEKKMGIQARFDLQGQVIGRLADVPMREGLHHHGEDPEAPGYTLEELFHLCRSTAMNQRVISLQTLAKIIYNYRLDNLGGSVDTPLIPKLLEAGLVFILRWSLDDTSEAGIAASIEGFKALLVQPTDEECLDKVFSWYRGYEMHPLCPVQYDDEGETGNKNPKDQHETELLEQDVVKGLLKMNFLERLRYILEVCRPAPNVVMNIFAILTRIGRHSPESCYEIIKCPRLMNTVFSSFLPTTWKPTNRPLVDDIYGYPAHHAMKLVRVLCMAGRNMAAVILSKYNLMSAIVRYTTQDPEDMQLYPGEAFLLSIESFHTWKIYISYGLASDSVRELYPVLMQHVQLFPRISVLPRPVSEEKSLQAVYELHMVRCAAILGLLEMTVHVGAMATDLQSKQSMRTEETERSPDFPVPSIDWSHVAGLLSPIELCFQRWMTEITNTDEPLSDYGLTLTNSCLNFIASFYGKVSQQPSYSAIEVLQHIEKFVGSIIVPFMTSGNFYSYVINLRTYSSYKAADSENSTKTSCMSLPDLQCHPVDDKQHPCIQHHSPYGFMSAFLRLVFIWAKMHKGIAAKFSAIIESSYVISYLEKTLQSPRSVGETLDRHFSRFEHIVLYYIVKIYQQVAQQTESCHQYSKLYHSIALLLFTSLHPGDEHIAHDLMSTVLFNTEYLVEGRIGDPEAVELAELLKVTDKDVTPKPQHQSLHGKEPNRGVLLRDAYSNLPSIRACYMTSFNDMMVAVARSRSKFLMIPCEIESHLLTEFTGALVPMDWTFLPLLQLYNQASKAELMGASMENLPGNYVMGITNTLRMIFMLETWRPDSINHISMAAKITRLMCVFLTGNDVFLEDTVHYYLSVLLRIYTQSDYLDKLDFNVPIPGVASFYDLYVVLLTQYGAVSFGDPIFASFLLLPLQQKYSVELKKAVWVEHQEVIRSLGMPIQECIVPVERFLTPQESNLEAIQMYMFALMSGLVRQSWSPILYLIAVHHVNGFLFDTKMNKTQQLMKAQYQMLKQVLDMKNQEVQQHLLLYRTINKDSFAGFDMFTELPAERQQLLQSIQQNQ